MIAPPAVAHVAAAFQKTAQGRASFRLHRVFDVHAGPSSRHDDFVIEGVYVDGVVTHVRVVSYTIGPNQADADQRAALVRQYEHPKPFDVFRPPYDPRYLRDYEYDVAGGRTVAFTSLVRDAAHGDGTFTYDAKGNVLTYSYVPNVLPKYSTSGSVSGSRSRVLNGYWATTAEHQEYSGHYSLFKGGATVEFTYYDFRRR